MFDNSPLWRNEIIKRRELWQGLIQLSRDITDEPWIVMGDFNAVLDDSEVNGYAADTSASMADFLECITESELTHLPFTGANFTWHNCSDGERSLWKRLDRMLVNEAWLVQWPQSKYISSYPRTSDHSPLILQGQDNQVHNFMFRFDNYMTKMPGFLRLVEEHWDQQATGTDMYILARKLKAMKPILRKFRKTHGDLSHNVQQAAHFLHKAQLLSHEFKHVSILLQLEKCCRMIYCKATTMEVNMLKQRAKIAWLKGGDNCTKIFFRKITARRTSQRVYQIQNEDGHLLTDYTAVTGEFVNYFKKLFGGSQRQSQNLDHLQPFARYLISETRQCRLAPLFKGEDVCRAVMEFFNNGRLLKQLNTTLITLIPKVQLPTKVGDFRPISCCNVVYKIITKIMVKRMQLVLEKLVDNCQNAFVPGRSISDNILLAQELLSAIIRKNYLPDAPSRFILWVEQCITTASFSLSLNGTVHGFFPSTRGLRQGDPISPYLFVLVMESLHLLIKNDLLLFCKAEVYSATVLHGILQQFKGITGLHANAQKSQILFSKAAAPVQTQIQTIFGFPQGTLPVRYLGVPLITSKLSIADCAPLILKIEARIAGWNQLKLTYAGRTQLIKSVLSSIHQYWCSVFILPKGVIKLIEAKLRNFLWRGGTATGGYKVAWEQVCKPTSHGGLGIRNIQMKRINGKTPVATNDKEGSWTWKKLLKLRTHLIKGIQYRIGDGTAFKLWLDPWHPDGVLLHKYPHGPLITGLPMDSPLSTVIVGDNWQWPSEHHIDINDIIHKLPAMHSGGTDAILWNNSSGTYSTETAYAVFSSPSTSVEWASLFMSISYTRHNFISLAQFWTDCQPLKSWCNSTNQGCVLCDGCHSETHNHLFFFSAPYTKTITHLVVHCASIGHILNGRWESNWASKRWRGSYSECSK
ncbi:UNVERIFIED_CONTAM: hypothetical protein Sangu_3008000 [Sesamum angustifolium]|uniref:Reverse transcriptase domain-containing protein n=1 Tax=Sesamum angustifolium TaxID=2727405 RepID=A0AAW2KM06_9LAMI